jgi:hypothetical protein
LLEQGYILRVPGAAQRETMRRRPGTPVVQTASTVRDRFFVYILASRYRGTLYVGVTNDLSRRMGAHKSGAVPGFSKKYKVNTLVY